MEQTDNNYNMYNMPPEEEDGIDIIALLKSLWEGRKTVLICTGVFIVLGLVAALTMKRTYTVSTVMVPQVSSGGSSSSLSSLASLAGINLSSGSSGSELSPVIYPQIVNSVPFRRELIYAPLHYAEVDSAVSMFTYSTEIAKPTVMGSIRKYTVGLPGVILGAIRGKKEPLVMPSDGTDEGGAKPLVIGEDEEKLLKAVGNSVSLSVDKKEGYLTLTVNGVEPIMTAELALKAQQLLQEEITRFRVEKSQSELEYIQARYDEVKAETELYQEQLAHVTDRSQDVTTTRARIGHDRIQAKYNLSNSIYTDIAKQLEQAKMQVKKDTPVFTIIQPVAVPTQPSNSRAKTLIIWTFLGIVLGCGIVLGKEYWGKLREQFVEN
ncbi:MAG: lipopolysaccharide biosynthesis protein [Bacteroidaceae bacterium]|nr:lipopolysaccharide biosynthesis protein [Bacteroidaceae bacterium]